MQSVPLEPSFFEVFNVLPCTRRSSEYCFSVSLSGETCFFKSVFLLNQCFLHSLAIFYSLNHANNIDDKWNSCRLSFVFSISKCYTKTPFSYTSSLCLHSFVAMSRQWLLSMGMVMCNILRILRFWRRVDEDWSLPVCDAVLNGKYQRIGGTCPFDLRGPRRANYLGFEDGGNPLHRNIETTLCLKVWIFIKYRI